MGDKYIEMDKSGEVSPEDQKTFDEIGLDQDTLDKLKSLATDHDGISMSIYQMSDRTTTVTINGNDGAQYRSFNGNDILNTIQKAIDNKKQSPQFQSNNDYQSNALTIDANGQPSGNTCLFEDMREDSFDKLMGLATEKEGISISVVEIETQPIQYEFTITDGDKNILATGNDINNAISMAKDKCNPSSDITIADASTEPGIWNEELEKKLAGFSGLLNPEFTENAWQPVTDDSPTTGFALVGMGDNWLNIDDITATKINNEFDTTYKVGAPIALT